MNEKEALASQIFLSDLNQRIQQFKSGSFRFAHYTSAGAAMKIIQNKEVWFRSTKCMNDFSEVQYGQQCLASAFRSESTGASFRRLLDKIDPDLTGKLAQQFDSWNRIFQDDTYITCWSEHDQKEEEIGRLSMWRAYGGNQSVAIILNSKALERESESNLFCADIVPVSYHNEEEFEHELSRLTSRMESNLAFLSSFGSDNVYRYIFEAFRNIVFTVKHPGFSEEKEWRVIYNPTYRKSKYIYDDIAEIEGTPQRIKKIRLVNIPEENFTGFEVPDLISKIVIGPSDNQYILGDAFADLLAQAGCPDSVDRIHYSGIPLRR